MIVIKTLAVSSLAFCLLGRAIQAPTDTPKPLVRFVDIPPEAFTTGTCQTSYVGYLEIHGNPHPSESEIGTWVLAKMKEGYSVTLHPQISGRIYTQLQCHKSKVKN